MLEGYFIEQTNKYIFERTMKRTFLSLYIVQFVCLINVLSKIDYFERTAFERKPKIRKVRKNGIRKKKTNFERTLFDQTTSSQVGRRVHYLDKYYYIRFEIFVWLNFKYKQDLLGQVSRLRKREGQKICKFLW